MVGGAVQPNTHTAVSCPVYATANASGGHLNPAVTVATIITGDTNIVKGLFYIMVQIIGAVCGSLLHVCEWF